jgi:hypothetical protein
MMFDVMVDLETLGTRAGCTVLSIGAVAFDSTTMQLGAEMYAVIARKSCRDAGLHEDEDTVAWWSAQSVEARAVLDAAESGIPLSHAMTMLTNYLAQFGLGNVRVWGNGADFDNAMLITCYSVVGEKQPWKYSNNRCYRTLKSMYPQVALVRQGVYHNALDDAKSQALHAMQILSLHGGRA